MNGHHTENNDDSHNPKSYPTDVVVGQQQHQTESPNPAEKGTCDDYSDWIERISRQAGAEWNDTNLADRLSIILSGIGLVVLIAYTIFTGYMYEATKESADAAKRVGEISVQQLEASQRAWVGLDGPVISDFVQPSPFFALGGHYTVKNFGTTPAIKVMALAEPVWDSEKVDYMNVGRTACEGPIEFVTNSIPHGPSVHSPGPMGYVLFPNQAHAEQVGGGVWTGAPIRAIKHFWFIGCIAYLDQFNTVHWTRFCVEPSVFAPQPLTAKTPLQFCSLFNDTDNNKERD